MDEELVAFGSSTKLSLEAAYQTRQQGLPGEALRCAEQSKCKIMRYPVQYHALLLFRKEV